MSKKDDERVRWKRYGRELAVLLWAVWDPLGGPPNEYQEYILPLWGLLARGVDEEEIAAQLTQFRTINMGLLPDQASDDETAAKLKEWWFWRFEWEYSPAEATLPELSD